MVPEVYCTKCGKTSKPTLIKKHSKSVHAKHVGIYCGECGKWIKWAKKSEIDIWDVTTGNELF